jgi:hypothetical protein
MNRNAILDKLEKLQRRVDGYNITGVNENELVLREEIADWIEVELAKSRQQHGRTWDAAIEAYEKRGGVKSRALTDFDNYEIK